MKDKYIVKSIDENGKLKSSSVIDGELQQIKQHILDEGLNYITYQAEYGYFNESKMIVQRVCYVVEVVRD